MLATRLLRPATSFIARTLKRVRPGLSVAFDLPTQTGYDSDHELARGEVGKVGVPVSHIGDMRTLFKDIPLEQMNTSMTINATAAWLLALYVAVAEEQGAERKVLTGTTQNDIIKEYLSRGTYVFPPEPSHEADHRHDYLVVGAVPEVEPDERVLVPPAGSRRDTGSGAGLRAGHGDCRAGRGEGIGPGAGAGLSHGCRTHQLLRECRHQVHNRAVQDAGLYRALGRDLP
jgi:hypothetical protein